MRWPPRFVRRWRSRHSRAQIRWMHEYIQRRYGPGSGYDPSPGWYERGGR